jgi:hypothetical protein
VPLFLAALVVGAAVAAGALLVASCYSSAGELARDSAIRARRVQLLSLFAPGIAAAGDDPRALLAWQPLAVTARTLFPEDFAELDRAAGASFPFSVEHIQAAHARWSADWLAWEQTHDAEYKLKAAALEEELSAAGGSAVIRARFERVEREKLERYQRRYEEYTRVSKALKALVDRPSGTLEATPKTHTRP